jgi:hypothetical protein
VSARAAGAAEGVQRFKRIADADQFLLISRREASINDSAGSTLL